jgi:uncharacterized protein YaaR (DUF327 family)
MERRICLKIQQGFSVSKERMLPTREKERVLQSFQQILQEKQSFLSMDRLHILMEEMEQQGMRLSKSRTLQDLMKYKQIIHEFLREVVQHGLSAEEHRGQQANGREKKLTLIKQVNQKLLELSSHVLEKNTSGLQVLETIGEIKGLLVNLYS